MAFQSNGTTADAIAALEDALTATARAAITLDRLLPHLDDRQRWEVVARVGDLGRANDAVRVRIAGDLAQRHDNLPKDERFPVACGYTNPLDMLTGEFGTTRRSARELLRVSSLTRPSVGLTGHTTPGRFPVLGAALADGALSLEAVTAIVDALGDAADRANPEHVAAAERALVAHATGERGTHPAEAGVVDRAMPPEMLAKVARGWRDAMDPDGVEPAFEEQLEARVLNFHTRADGCIAGNFVFTAAQGGVFAAAFDAFTRPKKPRFKDDGEREREREVDERTRGQKMADALIEMVRGAVEQGDVPRVGGEAPIVVLHMTQEAVEAAAAGEPGRTATIERTGEVVPIAIAAAIACDSYIQNVVIGTDGLPLYLGRKRRFFNRVQRRALAARDGGCRAPGCDAPVGWCDAHHIIPWSEGGKTDISNGILLCQHHHQEVHRGMLEIVWASGGWVVVAKTRPPRRSRGWSFDLQPEHIYPQLVA